jgi:hypothetical protein
LLNVLDQAVDTPDVVQESLALLVGATLEHCAGQGGGYHEH